MTDTDLKPLTISESAARRIRDLAEQEGQNEIAVRVAVHGGGCAGFQYGFSFDDAVTEDDRVFERNGARVVIDMMSLSLLQGSEIDFVEELAGSAFRVTNPNAASACSCGSSFAV
jgi:iron-sulfur cluster insertion protein